MTHVRLRVIVAALIAGALLVGASAARSATDEQRCTQGKYDAATRYVACALKALGKIYGTVGITRGQPLLAKCRVKYSATWPKLQAKWSGSGTTCDGPRFVQAAGEVFDNLTALEWEQKTDDDSIHDKDNQYTWSAGFGPANGTAFSVFLRGLNDGACFGDQCDWRLPTIVELQTILVDPCTVDPCIYPEFTPTVSGPLAFYWSATADSGFAWGVHFATGAVAAQFKPQQFAVRAVRGGL